MFKKLLILLVLLAVAVSSLLLLSLSDRTSIVKEQAIAAEDIKQARLVGANLLQQLSTKADNIKVTVPPKQLQSLAVLASHLTPKTEFVLNQSQSVIALNMSTQLQYSNITKYLNLRCLVIPDGFELRFEECYVGRVYLPNAITKYALNKFLTLMLGPDNGSQLAIMLDRAEVVDDHLHLTLPSAGKLKQQIKQSVANVSSFTTYLADNKSVSPDALKFYVGELNAFNASSNSLSQHINKAFELAAKRSENLDPIEENTAAIWALALTHGSKQLLRFTPIAANSITTKTVNSTLHQRRDLTQHFLYSAVLHQLGESSFALSIGQLKELMDSDGGTGFSFADMTANKAGMRLSEFATSNEKNARLVQSRLTACTNESCFIPELSGMVEGLNVDAFEQKYASMENEEYLKMEQEIDKRIAQLPIYQ